LSVGLSDVLDMYFGQSEKNLHAIFETARRNAPCVLFFDELDALGRKRSLVRHGAGHDVVNQLPRRNG
jgi:SpoVK/Ycf46/Vps4 family AAA+-type ATPase